MARMREKLGATLGAITISGPRCTVKPCTSNPAGSATAAPI